MRGILMKINSTKIDEVVCLSVNIGMRGAANTNLGVTAEYGYLADGMPCGQVQVVIPDSATDVKDAVAGLVTAVEEFFAEVVGEKKEDETPVEIRGLVQQEF